MKKIWGKEALKYTTKNDFSKKSPSAWILDIRKM